MKLGEKTGPGHSGNKSSVVIVLCVKVKGAKMLGGWGYPSFPVTAHAKPSFTAFLSVPRITLHVVRVGEVKSLRNALEFFSKREQNCRTYG